MWWLEDEKPEKFDKLDFCLQTSDGNIIVTLLINQMPLYDQIHRRHANATFETDKEKKAFMQESYRFELFEDDEVEERELFYHNFPQNLSPVDCKHYFVGTWVRHIYHALVYKHTDLEMFFLNGDKIPDDEFDEVFYDDERKNIPCLSCSCQRFQCGHISMEIKHKDGKIVWHNFNTFGEYHFEHVSFKFEETQYFAVLKRLKTLNDNMKGYEDYADYEQQRYLDSLEKNSDNDS